MPKHVVYNILNNHLHRSLIDGIFIYILSNMLHNGTYKTSPCQANADTSESAAMRIVVSSADGMSEM
jgi:hypothetical protein